MTKASAQSLELNPVLKLINLLRIYLMPSITSNKKMVSSLDKNSADDCLSSYLNMKTRLEDLVEISTLCKQLGVKEEFSNHEIDILYYILG